MRKLQSISLMSSALVLLSAAAAAQPLVNLGLVGVGRVPANSSDAFGPNVDTLGSLFSGVALDLRTVTHSGNTHRTTLYSLPDNGFGGGTQDYHNRIHTFSIAVTPYAGPYPTFVQNQIQLGLFTSMPLSVNGDFFTGFVPNDTSVSLYPKSLVNSLGQGRHSLDSEGLALTDDDGFFVADEYGPFIYRFDLFGQYLYELRAPEAYLPKSGATYGSRFISYGNVPAQVSTSDSGRYYSRGFEGVSLTPDKRKLVALLQSPLQQDGENRDASRNTRILIFDVDLNSATFGQLLGEYIYTLTLEGSEARDRSTLATEVLALSDTEFLVLEGDCRGRGGEAGPVLYKRVIKANISQATNLLGIPGTPFDLEKGAPGQVALPASGLPSGIVAADRRVLVNIADPKQLAKFNLNVNSTWDNNTLSDKWEGLAILPLNNPAAPNDYLLLVGNDNGFKASTVFHNGVAVGSNPVTVDSMMLAFRIGVDLIPPTVSCPSTSLSFSSCTMPDVTGLVTVNDNSAGPIQVSQSPAAGSTVALQTPVVVTVVAVDESGNTSQPCSFNVTLSAPTPTIACPAPVTAAVGANCLAAIPDFAASAQVSSGCGSLSVAQNPAAGSLVAAGAYTVTLTVTDSAGQSSSCSTTFTATGGGAPTISCPPPLTGTVGANCTVAVPNFVPDAVTTGCGTLTIAQNPSAGTLVPAGVYTVTLTVTDAYEQSSSCSTTFTATPGAAPTIACPAPLTGSVGANCLTEIPNLIPNVVVTGCGTLTVVQDPPAGTSVSAGVYTITLTVTDGSGRTSSCATTFTASGSTVPLTLTATPSQATLWPPNHKMVPVCMKVTATGGCSPIVSSKIIAVCSNEPVTGPTDNTSPDWEITGDLSVDLRAERADKDRVYTIRIRCTDAAGNNSTTSTTVTVTQ